MVSKEVIQDALRSEKKAMPSMAANQITASLK